MKKNLFVLLGFAVILLAGCSAGLKRPKDTNPSQWGNYKCTAQGGGQTYVGWSTHKSLAKKNALTICAERVGAAACAIVGCRNDT